MAYERKDGQGSLFPNEKQNDWQPDYKGYLQLNGKRYEVALWKRISQKGSEYLSIQASEREEDAQNYASSAPTPTDAPYSGSGSNEEDLTF